MGLPVIERFMSYVDVDPYGCWLWTGGKYPNGYGKFKLANGKPGGQSVQSHRWIYQYVYGDISNVINHICETKNCVNPLHLEDVTQKENVRYSLSDTCTRGHSLLDPDVYVESNGKRHCMKCVIERRKNKMIYTTTAGDIGEKKKHIILEPIENPISVPAEPQTVPAEPEKVGS